MIYFLASVFLASGLAAGAAAFASVGLAAGAGALTSAGLASVGFPTAGLCANIRFIDMETSDGAN